MCFTTSFWFWFSVSTLVHLHEVGDGTSRFAWQYWNCGSRSGRRIPHSRHGEKWGRIVAGPHRRNFAFIRGSTGRIILGFWCCDYNRFVFQEFVDLANIKKCNTFGGNMFVLEEYSKFFFDCFFKTKFAFILDSSRNQLIQRRYVSAMVSICTGILLLRIVWCMCVWCALFISIVIDIVSLTL